ncbi:hypothetical protein CH063_07378, partial [Colletotrichum higginsianum]
TPKGNLFLSWELIHVDGETRGYHLVLCYFRIGHLFSRSQQLPLRPSLSYFPIACVIWTAAFVTSLIRFSLPPLPDAGYMTLCSVSSSILATIGGEGKDRNWGFLFLRFIFPVIHPLPHTTQNTIVSHYYQHTHTHTHTHTQWPKTTQRKKGRENKTLIFVLLYTFVWAGYYDT